MFAVVAEEWFKGIEDLVEHGHRSPSTLGLYRHVLDRHVLPGLGTLRLSEVTPARVDRFLQDKRRSTGYSTAKLCRSVASGVCGLAVRRDALRSNPVRDVATLEKRGELEARALTPEECRDWLAILDPSELARRKDLPDLTRFLLGTGCRLGEGVGVRWEDLDVERHLLQVRRTVLRVKGHGLVAKQPKTRSGVRVLRIPFWLVQLLAERQAKCPVVEGPVFPDRHGGYWDRNNIEADYRKVREGTEFEWVVPHVYRKTVATMLDQGGLSARMIADQLGHSRISMTQDVYMGRRAVDGSVASALEGLFEVDEPGDEGAGPASLSVVS
jgi:integrase